MQTEIKQLINKTVKVDNGTIHFDSIVASPTLTVVKGSMNVADYDRISSALHGIELIANGKSVEIKGTETYNQFLYLVTITILKGMRSKRTP